ncbi:MAG: hypothetical protein LUH05_03965 [Candidatus Gastranaerophilales bacterium]|nr:hypothetical protein [Candidatus Gastranaerophilales bacterium]
MAYRIAPQTFSYFKGIREFNGVNSNGAISAINMENVELIQTEIGSETGIKSMSGNAAVYNLPDGYKAIRIFKSVQDYVTYTFIYGENEEQGVLYKVNLDDTLEELITGLSVTGNANGITMSDTAYDVFVFTNGEEAKTVCFAQEEQIQTIEAVDYLGRSLKWLSMTDWNGFLVVASQYGVHASHQNDIYTWNDDPEDVADSWYIDYTKKVTAVCAFTGGLYIFTNEDLSFLNTTPNDTANSSLVTSAMNGCYNFQSLVKHDIYLFFYDNNQKNIYYLTMTDTGQIRPAGPVAREIQSYFGSVDNFKMFSCVYGDKNEIWCIIENNENIEILIYDYKRQEWVKRVEQDINDVVVINNEVYTAGETGSIYIENINTTNNGTYYPAVYETAYINIGTHTNLKKQKTPLLLVLNDNFLNRFYVQLTVNGKQKNPKFVKVDSEALGVVYDETQLINGVIPETMIEGTARVCASNIYSKKVVEISTPQTWYTMNIKIYTEEEGQGFCISSMELKNIKGKTKTKGR